MSTLDDDKVSSSIKSLFSVPKGEMLVVGLLSSWLLKGVDPMERCSIPNVVSLSWLMQPVNTRLHRLTISHWTASSNSKRFAASIGHSNQMRP